MTVKQILKEMRASASEPGAVGNLTVTIDIVLDAMKKVMALKYADYGPDNILAFGEEGVLVRMYDKFSRWNNLERTNKEPSVKEESLVETAVDLANYCIIAVLVKRSVWGSSWEKEPDGYTFPDMCLREQVELELGLGTGVLYNRFLDSENAILSPRTMGALLSDAKEQLDGLRRDVWRTENLSEAHQWSDLFSVALYTVLLLLDACDRKVAFRDEFRAA